jgi:hypothetical protein
MLVAERTTAVTLSAIHRTGRATVEGRANTSAVGRISVGVGYARQAVVWERTRATICAPTITSPAVDTTVCSRIPVYVALTLPRR